MSSMVSLLVESASPSFPVNFRISSSMSSIICVYDNYIHDCFDGLLLEQTRKFIVSIDILSTDTNTEHLLSVALPMTARVIAYFQRNNKEQGNCKSCHL